MRSTIAALLLGAFALGGSCSRVLDSRATNEAPKKKCAPGDPLCTDI
jgi:hypothetical protein